MRFVKIGRRYFFGWQGEKRRYSQGYIEAFQGSQAEKEQVSIHKSCVVRLWMSSSLGVHRIRGCNPRAFLQRSLRDCIKISYS